MIIQETKNMESGLLKIREMFPILNEKVNGKNLVYFDNAATTQKPKAVIDSISEYYSQYNANIHRGIHSLAEKATAAFEETRTLAQAFLGAAHREEIIFTKGTTEGINLIAQTYGRTNLKTGDEILISGMEHHSNMVPWFMIAEQTGAKVKIIPVNDQGELDVQAYHQLLNEKTKIVACVHVSNALGTINPIEDIIQSAHKQGAVVVIDGAQSSSHLDIEVKKWDVDFFVCSGHKLYGPTGIGLLYGKKSLLEAMPPYQGGGEMIGVVRYDGFTVNELPYKFEAGTPNIADTVALKEAFKFINQIGKEKIRNHEDALLAHATKLIKTIDGIRIIGEAKNKVSILSFIPEGVHHQDLGILLDQRGIAIRTGHHCTQPLMSRFGISGTSRASFAIYNTFDEVEYFIEALKKSIQTLR